MKLLKPILIKVAADETYEIQVKNNLKLRLKLIIPGQAVIHLVKQAQKQ